MKFQSSMDQGKGLFSLKIAKEYAVYKDFHKHVFRIFFFFTYHAEIRICR